MIDLIQRSTIHGINHIYSSKGKLSKFFWFLLFLFGIIGISVNVFFVMKKYVSNPTILIYKLDHEEFTWPDLTFCTPTAPIEISSNSPQSQHWYQVFNQSRKIVDMLVKKSNTITDLIKMSVEMSSIDGQKLKIDNFEKKFLKIGYVKSVPEMRMFYNLEDFTGLQYPFGNLSSMFTTTFVQIFYNIPCFTFHIDRATDVNQNEIQSLLFLLKFNYDSYRLFNASWGFISTWLFVHNRNQIPKKPIILTPGLKTDLMISQSRFLYSGLQRPCRTEEFKIDLYDALLQSTQTFEGSEDDCESIESQKLLVDKCGCYSPLLPIFKNESGFPRICSNTSMFSNSEIMKNVQCLLDVHYKFRNETFKEKCSKYKPIKCDSLSYKSEVRNEMITEFWSNSFNEMQHQQFKQLHRHYFPLNNEENFIEQLKKSFVPFYIRRPLETGDFYKEQSEYPFSELLSDIGGLMGLWMGVSIVGLFEVVQLFYLYIGQKSIKDDEVNNEETNMEKC